MRAVQLAGRVENNLLSLEEDDVEIAFSDDALMPIISPRVWARFNQHRLIVGTIVTTVAVIAMCVATQFEVRFHRNDKSVAKVDAQLQASESQGKCTWAFQQCGGIGWGGAKCCDDGCTCEQQGPYYSSCKPPFGMKTCATPAGKPGDGTTTTTKKPGFKFGHHCLSGDVCESGMCGSVGKHWHKCVGPRVLGEACESSDDCQSVNCKPPQKLDAALTVSYCASPGAKFNQSCCGLPISD